MPELLERHGRQPSGNGQADSICSPSDAALIVEGKKERKKELRKSRIKTVQVKVENLHEISLTTACKHGCIEMNMEKWNDG